VSILLTSPKEYFAFPKPCLVPVMSMDITLYLATYAVFFCLLDSIAYIKMHAALTKRSLVAGIKKASPLEQTSCLEGFHSVLNQFSPKMLSYLYPRMFAR
jgi:hypothetical protein